MVDAAGSSTSTSYRTRRRFVEEGLEQAITEKNRPGGLRKLSAKQEALLVATACSEPPAGASRWTLQLLADQVVASTDVDGVSIGTIRRRLEEKAIKPWQEKMGCIGKLDAAYIARMEHVLDLYGEEHDPNRPVVNFDEALKQLVAETRPSMPAGSGQPRRYDYEYKRAGTSNIFLCFDRHRCWRHAKPTQRKTNIDFAEAMRDLVDVHYPDADVVRLVLDNLSIHAAAALYQAFAPAEARRILRRLEFHYTPKHASWLNMVEIEIGVMQRQCLDRRIPDRDELASELEARADRRNEAGATIQWLFDVGCAGSAVGTAIPNPARSAHLTPVTQGVSLN
ncbi:MAG: transposase [Myxococcota bacterium]|jgi:transposase